MATTGQRPFGQDTEAQRRWMMLIEWWEKDTGRRFGRYRHPIKPDAIWPPHPGAPDWIYSYGEDCETLPWKERDMDVHEVCKDAYYLSVGFCVDAEWEQSVLGADEVKYRHELHENLVLAARVLLEQNGWCRWSDIVPDNVKQAAETLVAAVNPFHPSRGPGHKMRTTIEARNRRATIHALDELRTDKGKQLSIKALTVLYLLCAPTTGLNDSRLIGYWWTDASQWNWTKTINWKELKPFFSSQAFMALSQSIRQDRSQLRKIRESAYL